MTRYLTPDNCILCGTAGRVEVTATTRRGGVVVFWHCQHCDGFWPVKPEEEAIERRTGDADRRRQSRADRRKRPGK